MDINPVSQSLQAEQTIESMPFVHLCLANKQNISDIAMGWGRTYRADEVYSEDIVLSEGQSIISRVTLRAFRVLDVAFSRVIVPVSAA